MAASVHQQDPVASGGSAANAPGGGPPPPSNGDSRPLMNGYSGPPSAGPGGTQVKSMPPNSPADTNGGSSTPPSSNYMQHESNGNGPTSYMSPSGPSPGGYPNHNFGPYGPPPPGSKGPPGPPHHPGMYQGGPYGSPGGGPGPTPTLNSLLQDRRGYPGGGYDGGPETGPPRGPPQGYGGSWGYPHPGYRPQNEDYLPMIEGEYSDPGSSPVGLDTVLPGPQRGTGRKRGRPKGSGRGRAQAKGTSPSQSPSPSPVGARPQYGGYPPQGPGGYSYGGPRPPYPGPDPRGYPHGGEHPPQHAQYGGPGAPPSTQGGVQDPASSDPAGPGAPPPMPGKHEGPPASTWMPPVQQKKRKGQSTNSLDTDGVRSPSDDGRPGSTEPANPSSGGLRGGPSPRPRPSPSPTGSSSSRSMSPAVPPTSQPGRPASRDSTNNGPPMSAAAMASPGPTGPGAGPGGYPPPPGSIAPGPGGPGGVPPNMGPPHHMYKGHGPMPGQPPYGYPGYGAPPRGPGGYPPGPYPGYPRNSSPGPPPGQYGQSGYGPYPPQPWASQNGKGGPPRHPSMADPRMGGPPGGSPYMPSKGPYGAPPASSYNGPQYNGPGMMPPGPGGPGVPPGSGMPLGSGPPGSNGPPGSSPSPHPPGMGPPQPSGFGGAPGAPPSSTPSTPPVSSSGASSDSASDSGAGLPPGGASIVTTGPDGQPLHDESSQQSTLSQSSDNSGGRQTPKGAYGQGYPGTPHSAPSPGGSLGSSQDDPYQRDIGSPGHWGRVPPSPAATPSTGYVREGGTSVPSPAPQQDTSYRTKQQAKVENLARLYEIDDHPERRAWLDKLLSFMEERGTPITQCPTISKNPLDLYRLYIYTKERGGFLETTNKKAWKDIAAQLGIGPSSSGAYTLKKHYGKNLLPYECRFDRGGIDPAPILAQVEAQSKKKSKSNSSASVRPPSPGSQDSHDSMSSSQDGYGGYPGQYNSYPPPGQGPPHPGYPVSGYPGGPPRPMGGPDGYPGPQGPPGAGYSYGGPPRWGPGQYSDGSGGPPPPSGDYGRWGGYPPRPGGYPPGASPGSGPPGSAPQLPPSSTGLPGSIPPTSGTPPASMAASSAPGGGPPSSAAGMSVSAGGGSTTTTSASPAYTDYQKPVGNGPMSRTGSPGPHGGPPTGHPHGGPMSPHHGGPPGSHHGPPMSPHHGGTPMPPHHMGGPVGPRMMMRPQGPHLQSSAGGGVGGGPSHPVILRANSPATPGTIQDSLPPALPVQRIPNPHGYAPPSSTSSSSGPGGMPPPPGGYPPKGPPGPGGVSGSGPGGLPGGPPRGARPPYPWPPAGGQFGGPHRPMYPGPPGYPSTSSSRPGAPPGSGGPPPPWSTADRGGAPPYGGPPGYNGPQATVGGVVNSWAGPRGPGGPPRPGFRPGGPQQPGMIRQMGAGRREMYNFPMESLECTQPLLSKRKKLNKMDVQPVDGWRLVLALRSGLLTESSWALDTLNILLYDDNSITYFGLGNMPGLLEALIEHWRASLVAMFDLTKDMELSNAKADSNRKRKRDRAEKRLEGVRWYESPALLSPSATKRLQSAAEDNDEDGDFEGLGCVNSEVLRRGDKVRILHHQPKDFTKEARFKEKEFLVDEKDDTLFIDDEEKDWDEFTQGFFSAPDLWAAGGGNTTDHIVAANCMQPELRLSFVRVMREDYPHEDSIKKEPAASEDNNGLAIKSEQSADTTNHKTSPNNSKKSPRGSRGGVREQWKVSPSKGEEKESSVKQNGPTTNSSDNHTNCNNNSNSKHNAPENSDENKDNVVTSETTDTTKVKSEGDEENHEKESSAVKNEVGTEDVIKSLELRSGLSFRDGGSAVLRRLVLPVLEEENYQPDHASLNLVSEPQDLLGRRGICVSTIFRNLSFVPGNEGILGNNPSFLAICGKLLLHGHWHPLRNNKQRNYDKPEEEEDYSDSCTSLLEQKEWWWEHLQVIRENVLVSLSNCSGYMDLSPHPEHIVLPLLSGLLEWAVSPSAVAQDPFPAVGMHSTISPQRLALETLCKLCVMEANVDLILSTPPFSRLEQLCSFLSRKLYRSEDQVMREFAINLLYYFSGADSGVARTVAQQDTCVSLLIGFIEQVENNAMVVAQQHGVNALRDNPESMGTSLDMLRRAANTLANLARHKDNRQVFLKQEQRLLNLVMSQILDQGVAGIISQVIFLISRN